MRVILFIESFSMDDESLVKNFRSVALKMRVTLDEDNLSLSDDARP
jgi:hypothetical protein